MYSIGSSFQKDLRSSGTLKRVRDEQISQYAEHGFAKNLLYGSCPLKIVHIKWWFLRKGEVYCSLFQVKRGFCASRLPYVPQPLLFAPPCLLIGPKRIALLYRKLLNVSA